MPLSSEILLTIKLQQQLFVDPKRIRLLREIEKCGSINQAAKNAKVSYKSAWDHLTAMNTISPKPLLERNIGGGGGTALTIYAQRLLQLYDLLEQTQQKAFNILQDETLPLDSLLQATSHFSLKSSARNQFLGKITQLVHQSIHCFVSIQVEGSPNPFIVSITEKSAVNLKLELNKEVILMIKAPWIRIYQQKPNANQHNLFPVKIEAIQNKGENKEAIFTLATEMSGKRIEFCATVSDSQQLTQNRLYWIYIDPEQIILATL